MNTTLQKRLNEIEELSRKKALLLEGVTNDTVKWAGVGLGIGVGLTAILVSFGTATPAVLGGIAAARGATTGLSHGWRSAKNKKKRVEEIDIEMRQKTKKLIDDLCKQINSSQVERGMAFSVYKKLSRMDSLLEDQIEVLAKKLEEVND